MTGEMELGARVFARHDGQAHTMPAELLEGEIEFVPGGRRPFQIAQMGRIFPGALGTIAAIHWFRAPGCKRAEGQAVVRWDAWENGAAHSILWPSVLGEIGSA